MGFQATWLPSTVFNFNDPLILPYCHFSSSPKVSLFLYWLLLSSIQYLIVQLVRLPGPGYYIVRDMLEG